MPAAVTLAEPASETDTAIEIAPDGFQLYEAEQFQIQLPAGWQATSTEGEPTIITSPEMETDPAAGILTEIQWRNQPPGELVPIALEQIETEGHAVRRYRTLMVDGVTALRLWLAEVPETLPYATVTYVGYEQSTAVLTSRYSEPTQAVDDLLSALHGSFRAIVP
jgi:hypothetical protein